MPGSLRSSASRLSAFLGCRGKPRQWLLLLVGSGLFVLCLEALHLPAALLLGPMAAAIIMAASDTEVRVPPRAFYAAQAVVGCLIGRGLPASIFGQLAQDWILFATVVLAVIGFSAGIGILLTRWQVLPGTTAIWGSSPGAATAMTLMAESFGADMRLVAFMQYQRVIFVVIVASLVSAIFTAGGRGAQEIAWFPAIVWPDFAETLTVAAAGAIAGRVMRIPAGPLLVPLFSAAFFQDIGLLRIELPPWLLAISYAFVGWSIGLRFNRPILRHAAHAFPRIAAAVLSLIALCGGLAVFLVVTAGVDPLTAYLATSPGGADSVAIIAASTHVDIPFVMAMQACRMVVVLLTGPALTRLIVRWMRPEGR